MVNTKYVLLRNTAYIDYHGDAPVEIAKIVDYLTNKDVMLIYYEKNLFRIRGLHTCVVVCETEAGTIPVAFIDDLHRACLFEHREIFFSLMLHELGHFKNGDFNNALSGTTTKTIKDERLRCILEGCVQEIEKNADAFAVSVVGEHTVVRMLDYLIDKRRERKDKGMELAIREFELRKEAVQSIK